MPQLGKGIPAKEREGGTLRNVTEKRSHLKKKRGGHEESHQATGRKRRGA